MEWVNLKDTKHGKKPTQEQGQKPKHQQKRPLEKPQEKHPLEKPQEKDVNLQSLFTSYFFLFCTIFVLEALSNNL